MGLQRINSPTSGLILRIVESRISILPWRNRTRAFQFVQKPQRSTGVRGTSRSCGISDLTAKPPLVISLESLKKEHIRVASFLFLGIRTGLPVLKGSMCFAKILLPSEYWISTCWVSVHSNPA